MDMQYQETKPIALRVKSYWTMFVIAIFVILIDQASKYAIRANLALRETWMPIKWVEPWFRIIHWKNTGVAFGLFQGIGWIFTLIGLVVILLIILFYRPVYDGPKFWRVALALQLGGAIGNLIDRFNPSVGYVVDFLWVHHFPVFNLADTAIVVGAIVMVIGIWREEEKTKQMTVDPEPADENHDSYKGIE